MREILTLTVSTAAMLLVIVGLAQFVFWLKIGYSARRVGRNREQISRILVDVGVRERPQLIVGLIACLDEETVIGRTVSHFLEQSESARVVVVDDGSSDATAAVASSAGGDRVLVVERRPPDARQGKGPALNAGFAALTSYVASTGVDPSSVVVCVMDADGILSTGCLDAALNLFSDPKIGGVQIPVEIRNRPLGRSDDRRPRWTRLLTIYQDYEFYALSARQQVARGATGSVSLGGNGQFTRLSALLMVDEARPWSTSLTEDLDLAISLMTSGWELHCLPDHRVSQEGVESMRKLLRQRTRWMQGHIMCSRRIAEVWRSPRVPLSASIEVISYLSVPLGLILPWSIVSIANVPLTVGHLGRVGESPSPLGAKLAIVASWYLLSFFPHLITGWFYWRSRAGETSRLKAFLLAHGFVAYTFITFAATWRAVARIAKGEHGWVKTERIGAVSRSSSGPAPRRSSWLRSCWSSPVSVDRRLSSRLLNRWR
mgnify:CR=1 FL=1